MIQNNAHFLFRNIMNPVSNTEVVDGSIRILCETFIDWCVYMFLYVAVFVYAVCMCMYMYEYTCMCILHMCMYCVCMCIYTCVCMCMVVCTCVWMQKSSLSVISQKCHPPYFERQGPLISLELTVTEAGW